MAYKDLEDRKKYQREWCRKKRQNDPDFQTRVNEAGRQYYYENRDAAIARVEEVRLRRTAILAAIKIERGCMDCGYNLHPEALEFDHRPGTEKLFGLANAHKFSAEKVEAEITKCDIVCSNCHRIRTSKRREDNFITDPQEKRKMRAWLLNHGFNVGDRGVIPDKYQQIYTDAME